MRRAFLFHIREQNMQNKLLEIFKTANGISIDSRNVLPGNIFFALKGEHTDGNVFAQKAIENGAVCAVIDDAAYNTHEKCLLVNNSLESLQQLAADYRNTLSIPFIAITGSNGKTTTKELTHAVLQKKYSVFATKGNLNNHIGVPLSVLSVTQKHDMAIIEMGANHLQEISFLCSIAKPTHGLITNIGKAHLEGFGGEEGVKEGKSELYEYLKQTGGVIFANSGQKKLFDVYENYKPVKTFGFYSTDFLTGNLLSGLPFASVSIDGIEIISNLVGQYNAENILAAACIGKYFGVSMQEIKEAVETYKPVNNRSEWKEIKGNHFILDAYNANPSSMQAAIENFQRLDATPKILILGDMLEMGKFARQEHEKILHLAAAGNFSEIITVGKEFAHVAIGKNVKSFITNTEAKTYFDSKNFKGVYFLLKGSRGIALEKIIE